MIVTLWWLLFFAAFGLCLGSFINVVIHRLPRGVAISNPVWSFCPHCRNSVAWYDNLPVISYLLLRGRCRNCWKPIAPRYFVVELMTAMMVIVLVDTFFIAATRQGLADATDINWRLADDWPIFLAHVILFGCLLAMSAIDIQYYWVDIRFTHLAAACGLVLHTIWTPVHSRQWPRPLDATAFAATAAFIGFAAVWLVLQLTYRQPPHGEQLDDEPDQPETAESAPTKTAGVGTLLAPLIVFAFLLVTAVAADGNGGPVPFTLRAGLGIVFFLGVILYEAAHVRESDTEIVEAIESEAPRARRIACGELATLMPGILLGVVALWITLRQPEIFRRSAQLLHWAPFQDSWQPLWGLSTAVSGYVIAAGIGWFVRIVANLLLGKEAFATGDIHMMAAAGCVVGWQVVLLGFVASCFLAVIGWLMLLPIKRTRAIPLGPWLAIGFFVVVAFYNDLIESPVIRNVSATASLLFLENSQPIELRVIP